MRQAIFAVVVLAELTLPESVPAAVELDSDFWDTYDAFEQYSPETFQELIALREGDLLATGRDITHLELRVIGRDSIYDKLISARAVIDRSIGRRLQVKVLPYSLSPNASREPTLTRRLLTLEQTEALLALLDETGFWEAPYSLDASLPGERQADPTARCPEGGHWIVEAVRPGTYQLVARSTCDGLDPAIGEIRDFLLGIAGISP